MGERLIYPALILAVLSWHGPRLFLRFGAFLSWLQVVLLACTLIVLPKGAGVGASPGNGIISDGEHRSHLSFWHRPFMFLGQIEAAQKAAGSGHLPTSRIGYATMTLSRKTGHLANP